MIITLDDLSTATLDDLLYVAAKAQVEAERRFGYFCDACGRRMGLTHVAGCTRGEGMVDRFDCTAIETRIEMKAIELRGGKQ